MWLFMRDIVQVVGEDLCICLGSLYDLDNNQNGIIFRLKDVLVCG